MRAELPPHVVPGSILGSKSYCARDSVLGRRRDVAELRLYEALLHQRPCPLRNLIMDSINNFDWTGLELAPRFSALRLQTTRRTAAGGQRTPAAAPALLPEWNLVPPFGGGGSLYFAQGQ
jgi:hypothetical protein